VEGTTVGGGFDDMLATIGVADGSVPPLEDIHGCGWGIPTGGGIFFSCVSTDIGVPFGIAKPIDIPP
jgi:hypothetical protein